MSKYCWKCIFFLKNGAQARAQSLNKNETWKLVEKPNNQKLVDCKWIYKLKEGVEPNDPSRYKATHFHTKQTYNEIKVFQNAPDACVFSPIIFHWHKNSSTQAPPLTNPPKGKQIPPLHVISLQFKARFAKSLRD